MKKMMLVVKTVLVVLVLVAGAGAAYIHSGAFEIAADRGHHPMTQWAMQTTRDRAIARRARAMEPTVPDTLSDDALLEAVVGYEDMCAACHAPPGGTPSALARGLNPPPTDLARTGRSAEELFWVTKHGIKMSGMPAWGVTHSDAEIWPLVALIQRFPRMSGDEYERMLVAAREAGVEHVHDHGDVDEDDEDERHQHHDHGHRH